MPEPPHSYKVCLGMRDLNGRRTAINKMLSPLVDKPKDLFVNPHSSTADFIWAVQQRGDLLTNDYTDRKFKTKTENLYASYYERWFRYVSDNEEGWYLDRAYLNFYQLNRQSRSSSEFLLLHCDPNEKHQHAIYKKSPHLHFVTAPDPFPHAHIALNLNYLELMLNDVQSLTTSFASAIVMLKEQILDSM